MVPIRTRRPGGPGSEGAGSRSCALPRSADPDPPRRLRDGDRHGPSAV